MRLIVVNAVDTDARNNETYDLIKSSVENLEIIKCKFDTVNDLIQSQLPTVFVIFATNNSDVQKSVTLFEGLKASLSKSSYRGILIAGLTNHKVHDLFKKIGCSEIIEPNIKAKSLFYKLNLGFRALKSQFDQNAKDLQFGQKRQDDSSSKEKSAENTKLKFEVKKANQLSIECDFWLRKEERDTKMLMGKWYLRLMGPSPMSGSWESTKVEFNGKEVEGWIWKFKSSEHQEKFNYHEGSWYYIGQKPDYDWRADRWTLISKNIEMFFKLGETVHKKIVVQDELLTIAENSAQWLAKENIIRETFDQEIAIKNQKQNQEGEEIDLDTVETKEFNETLDPELEAKQHEIKTRDNNIDNRADAPSAGRAGGKLLRMDKNSPADKIDQFLKNEENKTENIINEAWTLESNAKVFNDYSISIRLLGTIQNFGVCNFYDKINEYIYLKGKKKNFSMGNNPIQLEIKLNYGEFTGTLGMSGMIESISEEKEDMIFKIKIVKDAENNIDKVLKIIDERQKNIGTFFNLARGF